MVRPFALTLSLTLALSLAFVGDRAGAAQTRGIGTVRGEVHGEHGERVARAVVRFMMPTGQVLETRSDDDGRWKLVGVGRGEWRVLFSARGYVSRVTMLVVDRETLTSDAVTTVLRRIEPDAR